MAIYAHICGVTGKVLDPIERESEADYRKLFHQNVTADWDVQEVPATTVDGNPIKHNAVAVAGGYRNQEDIPPPPPVIHEPVEEEPE